MFMFPGGLYSQIVSSSIVTDEDDVRQTYGGAPRDQNRDIHLTCRGRDCKRGYQVPPRDVTTEGLRHDYQASLRFAALGNYHRHLFVNI